jgi:transposase
MLRVEYARWDQTPADLRELAMSASHPRTRERFLALYEITQESCATRVAERTRRHPQTVMEWLHLYNIRGPEAISAPAPPLPGDRGKPRRDSPCGPTIRRSSAGSRSRSATALRRLVGWVRERFGRTCCRETIRAALHRLGLSWKKKLLGRSAAPACRADPGSPRRCPARPPSAGLPGRSAHPPGCRSRLWLVGARPAPLGCLALAASVGQALVLRPLSLQRRPSAALALCPRQRRAHHRCSAPTPNRMAQLIVVGASYHRAGVVREAATALQIDLVPLPGYIHAGRGARLREDVTYHHCHPTAEDLSRRVTAFETRLNQDPCAIADRLKDHLNPDEEKLRFSR